MSVRKDGLALLPWLLCAVCVTSVTIQAAQWALALEGRPTLFDAVERLGWGFAVASVFAVLAALIITRQPRNTVGWLMMIPALLIAVPQPAGLESQFSSPPANPDVTLLIFAWLNNWSWLALIFPIMLIPLHFPTGAPPSPRWRAVDYLAIIMIVIFMLAASFGMTFNPNVNGVNYSLPNPIGFIPEQVVGAVTGVPWVVGLLTLVGASVASLFVRYRHSGLVVRQQIKWLLLACLFFALVYAGTLFINTVTNGSPSPTVQGWNNLFLVLSVLTIPVAIAVAILRYRLYDIDVIVRKTLLYAILTALLALVYFGLVLLLQTIFGAVAGEQSPAIIVISTLVIAALFAPLRRRVQEVLDRRFFRKKYDAQQVLADFAQTAREETELEMLSGDLARVVQETMQPQGVSIWLNGRASS